MIKRLTITLALFLFALVLQVIGFGVIAATGFMLWVTFSEGRPLPIVEALLFALAAESIAFAWKIAREETATLLADDN